MKGEYITVKDFASRLGITPQAVYKRLESDIKPFVKLVNGQKHINIVALALFDSTIESTDHEKLNKVEYQADNIVEEVGNQNTADDNHNESVESKVENDVNKAHDTALLGVLNEAVNTLKDQLAVKDVQIAELNDRLREAQQLNHNNQVLLGVEQQSRPSFWRRLFKKE